MILRLLKCLSCLMFILSGVLAYAFVLDVEPLSPEKAYSVEKEAFDRNNDDWSREFPDFAHWLGDREEVGNKMREWAQNVGNEAALQYVEIWDTSFDRSLDRNARAPDSWVPESPDSLDRG